MALKYAPSVIDASDLGLATLDLFLSEYEQGIEETKPNAGPRIAEYANRFGLTPPLNCFAGSISCVYRPTRYNTGDP